MDMVKITCYGKTEMMTRADAIKLYREGVACCEGSERDRYTNILIGLLNGDTEVSDEY